MDKYDYINPLVKKLVTHQWRNERESKRVEKTHFLESFLFLAKPPKMDGMVVEKEKM